VSARALSRENAGHARHAICSAGPGDEAKGAGCGGGDAGARRWLQQRRESGRRRRDDRRGRIRRDVRRRRRRRRRRRVWRRAVRQQPALCLPDVPPSPHRALLGAWRCRRVSRRLDDESLCGRGRRARLRRAGLHEPAPVLRGHSRRMRGHSDLHLLADEHLPAVECALRTLRGCVRWKGELPGALTWRERCGSARSEELEQSWRWSSSWPRYRRAATSPRSRRMRRATPARPAARARKEPEEARAPVPAA